MTIPGPFTRRVREIYRARGWSDALLDKRDVELRRKLAEEDGLSPKLVEVEFERVMALVFKQLAH
jgi:hypothetical protein